MILTIWRNLVSSIAPRAKLKMSDTVLKLEGHSKSGLKESSFVKC